MANTNKWNRTGGGVRRPRICSRLSLRWIAVVLLAVTGGVAWWAFRAREETTRPADDRRTPPSMIAEAKPNIATNVVVEAPKSVDPNARPTKVGEVVNGYVMLPSGRIHKPTGVVTNYVANYGKSKYSIFEHRSDNEIAALLMMNPGDTLVGTKRYDNWFAKQFLKSMETPIVASAEDEPWKVDLKKSVIQARLELKKAYDNGEDIEAIMAESRQQLQDLSKYKQSMKKLYVQTIKECKTEKQVDELQQAVNMMLEEKGCAPMDFTPLTKINLLKGNVHEE